MPFISKILGENADKDLAAVERVDGDKVEDGQANIEEDEGIEEGGVKGGKNEADKQAGKGSQDKIAGRASQRDESGITARIGEIVGIKLNRSTPAKAEE